MNGWRDDASHSSAQAGATARREHRVLVLLCVWWCLNLRGMVSLFSELGAPRTALLLIVC